MKKAIIETGGKQHCVAVGDLIKVDLIHDTKTLSWHPLLLIDGSQVRLGRPYLEDVSVKAEIVEAIHKEDKILSIRFKAKKRVHKVRGHRQKMTIVKVKSIVLKKAKIKEGNNPDKDGSVDAL